MPDASWVRWIFYQLLRCLTIFSALLLLSWSLGLIVTLTAAALFGLTIRYDYWSNTVELLAVAFVIAGGVHGWHWGYLLAIGLVLGTGRETLPFLALLGTPQAIALGAGALASHLAIRLSARTESHWLGTLEYANPMWQTNWKSLRGEHGASVQWQVGIYLLVGGLAVMTAPLLALPLLLTTALIARIDEPRVLTMLVPFAALSLTRLL